MLYILLIKTADNIIIFFDSSSSTNRMAPGTNISKVAATKALLKKRNQWLPDKGSGNSLLFERYVQFC